MLASSEFKIKKKDILLIIIILIFAFAAFVVRFIFMNQDAATVVVQVDGKVEKICSLSENQKIQINHGTNVIEIKGGQVKMIKANCPDLICVHHKAISKGGENIICLPNKVVVTIESEEKSNYDSISQ